MKIALIILGLIVLHFVLIILIATGVYVGMKQFFDEQNGNKRGEENDKI